MCYTVKLVLKKNIIATQELEIEAPSEKKPNQHPSNCYVIAGYVLRRFSPPSPSVLPSCWRTASVSAQTLSTHAAWGHREIRYDLNILSLIVYQPSGQRSHPWNAPRSAERFHFSSPAPAKGSNVAAGLVIRSHLSLL